MFPEDIREAASKALEAARVAGIRIATAETCTAGLVSAALTSVPGASEIFDRGYVLYHASAKSTSLGVSEDVAQAHVAEPGDTVWLGAIDAEGRAVSFIQSIYWEFGSGLVLPGSGVLWQNRGTSFSLDENDVNHLVPGRLPFHTIQPAMALFDDGRVMPYGTMGGEGQPQTQAMVFSRYALYGQELQSAVTAPRWLLGRTWGAEHTNLRIENRFGPEVFSALEGAGHDIDIVGPFDEVMGHAGALVLHKNGSRSGVIEAAADPRGDGVAAGF